MRRKHLPVSREPERLEWADLVTHSDREFLQYGPAPLAASGGFGAGKTRVALLKALMLSDQYPNNCGIIMRTKETDLRETTLRTLWKLCPKEAWSYMGRRNDDERIVQLNNGSRILWWFSRNDASELSVLKGLEINWAILDQAEEFSEEVFDIIDGRLGRWDKAVLDPKIVARYEATHKRPWPWRNPQTGRLSVPCYMMMTCNPTEDLDHWLYRRFHPESDEHYEKSMWDEEHQEYMSPHDKGWRMITFSSRNNRFLNPENLNKMLGKGKDYVDRLVDGKWGSGEGQIHRVDDLSLIPGDPEWVAGLLKRSTLYRILDHGDSSPTCVASCACDKDGNLFVYAEHYKADASISRHRQAIYEGSQWDAQALAGGDGVPRPARYRDLADPSIFGAIRQRKDGRKFVSDEYTDREYGKDTVVFWQPADNDELGTRNRINEYLAVDPNRVHPYTGQKGSPRLFFITRTPEYPRGCYRIVLETRKQRKLKVAVLNGRTIFSDERDPKVADHGYDVVRYFVADRPFSIADKPKSKDVWTPDEIANRFRRPHSFARTRGGRLAVLRRLA